MQPTDESLTGHRRPRPRASAAAVLLLILAATQAPAQTTASLFDDREVHDIRLTVQPGDWQTLRDNYLLDTYYPADFTWNRHSLSRIGIRSRGSGSRSPLKPNLLLAFNRYDGTQQLLGLPSVILKANNQDASLLHEIVTMNLFRRMGIPAPREAPARLYINGEFFGAYTLVEVIDEAFLRRNFGEDTGYLYDWEENRVDGYRFGYLGPDPASYSPAIWSPKTNRANPDPATIEAMVRAVNFASDAEFESAVSEFLDLKQVMTYLAVESFMADFDGFLGDVFGMNNIYFYRFAGTRQMQLLPWDKDNSFDWEQRSLMQGVEENVLARRAMRIPALRNLYLEALGKAADLSGGSGGWMEREIDRFYHQVREMAHADPNKQCPAPEGMQSCGGDAFEAEVERMRGFVSRRAGFVMAEAAAAGYVPSAGAPRLLESGLVSASAPETSTLAPGSLAAIYGLRLAAGRAEGALAAPPTKLAGVVVAVNGARAPLLFVSAEQVNAQIPWDTVAGQAAVTIFVDGAIGNTIFASVSDFAPGIFMVSHQDGGAPVDHQQPAQSGETLIIYATGLGPVSQSPSPEAFASTLETPSVTVGGLPAPVELSGLAPGLAGVYQVKIQLPVGLGPGSSAPLVLTMGGHAATTSIAVAGPA